MSNEYALNVIDVNFAPTFALPTQVGEANGKTSAVIDLGAETNGFRAARFEVELLVPTLSSTIVPSGSTAGANYEIQFSASSTFNASVFNFYRENFVGTGLDQKSVRLRIPANSPRYIRGKVWLGTTCTDASAVTGTFRLLF